MYKIGLSLVLFNEPEIRFLKFLENFKKIFKNYNTKIIVFLNSQHNYKFPDDILIFKSKKNVGYGKGHNHNYEWFKKNGFQKVIISNTDLKIKCCPKKFLSNNDVALTGPLIRNEDGSNQKVTRALPTLFDKIKSFYGQYPYYLKEINSDVRVVPHISGCFFLINISIYNKQGFSWLFDPIFFMYEEDTDLCRRLYGKNLILFDPSLVITHNYEKGSSSRLKLFLYHLKSIIYYFNKWGIMDKKAIQSRKLIEDY